MLVGGARTGRELSWFAPLIFDVFNLTGLGSEVQSKKSMRAIWRPVISSRALGIQVNRV